jgi:hypothetical protein
MTITGLETKLELEVRGRMQEKEDNVKKLSDFHRAIADRNGAIANMEKKFGEAEMEKKRQSALITSMEKKQREAELKISQRDATITDLQTKS